MDNKKTSADGEKFKQEKKRIIDVIAQIVYLETKLKIQITMLTMFNSK